MTIKNILNELRLMQTKNNYRRVNEQLVKGDFSNLDDLGKYYTRLLDVEAPKFIWDCLNPSLDSLDKEVNLKNYKYKLYPVYKEIEVPIEGYPGYWEMSPDEIIDRFGEEDVSYLSVEITHLAATISFEVVDSEGQPYPAYDALIRDTEGKLYHDWAINVRDEFDSFDRKENIGFVETNGNKVQFVLQCYNPHEPATFSVDWSTARPLYQYSSDNTEEEEVDYQYSSDNMEEEEEVEVSEKFRRFRRR